MDEFFMWVGNTDYLRWQLTPINIGFLKYRQNTFGNTDSFCSVTS